MVTADYNNLEMMIFLLDKGADMEAKNHVRTLKFNVIFVRIITATANLELEILIPLYSSVMASWRLLPYDFIAYKSTCPDTRLLRLLDVNFSMKCSHSTSHTSISQILLIVIITRFF